MTCLFKALNCGFLRVPICTVHLHEISIYSSITDILVNFTVIHQQTFNALPTIKSINIRKINIFDCGLYAKFSNSFGISFISDIFFTSSINHQLLCFQSPPPPIRTYVNVLPQCNYLVSFTMQNTILYLCNLFYLIHSRASRP
jgi:hypothetical protein